MLHKLNLKSVFEKTEFESNVCLHFLSVTASVIIQYKFFHYFKSRFKRLDCSGGVMLYNISDCNSLHCSILYDRAFRTCPKDEELCCANNVLHKYIIDNYKYINNKINRFAPPSDLDHSFSESGNKTRW